MEISLVEVDSVGLFGLVGDPASSLTVGLDEVMGLLQTRSFGVLFSNDSILPTVNSANIQLLSKQHVFTSIIPLISRNL